MKALFVILVSLVSVSALTACEVANKGWTYPNYDEMPGNMKSGGND